MNLFYTKLLNSFKLRKIVKVISGLDNFNINKIYQIVNATNITPVSYIDLSANTKILSLIKKITNLPLCVSSIDPLELYNCHVSGADIVEIGNFDAFYIKYINFTAFDILKLSIETRRLIPIKDICVTIPHLLTLYEQTRLAKKLEKLGVNFLQTEGLHWNFDNIYINLLYNYKYDMVSKSLYIAAPTLSSTYVLSRSVNLPIITSSKISHLSSSLAFSYGASGIGIKSIIYNKSTIYKMSFCLSEMLYTVNYFTKSSFSLKLIRSTNKMIVKKFRVN